MMKKKCFEFKCEFSFKVGYFHLRFEFCPKQNRKFHEIRNCHILYLKLPGGHSNTSVVHMRETQKRGLFWDWMRYGQKVPVFKKKGPFLNSIRGYFWTPIGENWEWNCANFLFRGVFSWNGQICITVCFENLWSPMCTTLVFECPHPPPTPGIKLVILFDSTTKSMLNLGNC